MTRRFLLILLIVVWAVSWPVSKVGVSAVPPIWFACLRFSIATVVLFAINGARGTLRVPSRGDWRLVLISGALQMAAYSALISTALTKLPAGRAALLAFTTPLWVLPLAVLLGQERASLRASAGVATGVVGIVVIVLPSLAPGGDAPIAPYAMLIGAAVAWAISIVAVRGHRFELDPLTLAPWQTLFASAVLAVLALATEGRPSPIDARGLIALAYVAPIATALAYWIVVEVGRHMAPSRLAVALLATPCLGLLLSAMLLHESIDTPLIVGMVLVAVGITLSTSPPSLTRPRSGA